MAGDTGPELPKGAEIGKAPEPAGGSPSDQRHAETFGDAITRARRWSSPPSSDSIGRASRGIAGRVQDGLRKFFPKTEPLSKDETRGVIDDAVTAGHVGAEQGQQLKEDIIEGADKP